MDSQCRRRYAAHYRHADLGAHLRTQIGHARATQDDRVGRVRLDRRPARLGDDPARVRMGAKGEHGNLAGMDAAAEPPHPVAFSQIGGPAHGPLSVVTTLNPRPRWAAVRMAASAIPITGPLAGSRAASRPESPNQARTYPSTPSASPRRIAASRPGTLSASS
ncbi:hypothetical protein IU479_24030 [Nocardia abscessus]|nr:hypothetical protein [Nocardia abscessus]